MNDDHKKRFLQWLDRFARVPAGFRKTIEWYSFSEQELLRLKPQVEAKYRVKKEFLGRKAGS